ncbi:MAG: type I glutamate--ammonia ligase [Bdellovibrionales bacterium]
MTPNEAIAFGKENGAVMVDFKFVDLLGAWQHFTVPIAELTDEVFEEGLGFDGSSIRGWQSIEESDMIYIPVPSSAKMDPFNQVPTMSFIGNIHRPETLEPYERDPRTMAQRAMAYLKSTGIADTAYFGPEAEFFIFDDIRFDSSSQGAFYSIDSEEAAWNTGSDEFGFNLGYKARHKGGYFPAMPTDKTHDIRTEMCLELDRLGLQVERQHHEVATAGQGEIDIRFDKMLDMADKMMWFKYVIKNVARRHDKTATFMPKPVFNDNGSGMHTHISLWKDGSPLFAGDKYAGLSQMALHFIGGILRHAPALCAFTNPSTNSYKRLVPGFEAPTRLAYSYRNRSAAIRIPMTGPNPKKKRIEFRTPDPTANPYIAFSALLLAGLDGVENKIDPGKPFEKDIYGLSAEELKDVPEVPATLDRALNNLRNDHEFLLKGDAFSTEFVNHWCDFKYENEVLPVMQRPVPHEFELYYDI